DVSSRFCGYSYFFFPATLFGDFFRSNWRRKVATRRHSIPEFVEVVFQVSLKVLDRFVVDPCCSLIRFYPFVRFPDFVLGNTERLCLTHRAPPIAGWLIESGPMTQRLRSIPLSGTSPLLRAVPSLSLRIRNGYRPGKSALDAVGQARQRCWRNDWVLDLDIKGFLTISTKIY